MAGIGRAWLSRRRFTRTVAGSSLIAGLDALTGASILAQQDTRGEPLAQLPPLDGELLVDPATLGEYASDYGRIVHKHPVAVLRPASVADVSRIVGFARRSGLKIAARGQAHQPFGQAQVDGGIVIDMRSLRVVRAIAADQVEVDAGADWRDVLRAALPRDLMPPVLTNFLGLTVGGTLAIGGVGVTAIRQGAQVDQTVALDVVTGDGGLITCSQKEHRDLFDAALAGQGQCCIIARATLRLTTAPTSVREFILQYPDLPTLMQDGARLTQDTRFDGAVALLSPADGRWSYTLTAILFVADGIPDDERLLAGLRVTPGSAQVRTLTPLEYFDTRPPVDTAKSHADIGLCVPHSAAESFIAATLPRLTAEDLGTADGIRLFFYRREDFKRPLFRVPDEARFCYLALLRSASGGEALARTIAGNRALFEINRNLGGALYPFAALNTTESDWERHYGGQWAALVRAKHRYDPARVFASGPGLTFS